MANQLLATFYIELSQIPPNSVSAAVQHESSSNYWTTAAGLSANVDSNYGGTNVPYNVVADGNKTRYRYKIDVERTTSTYYDYEKNESVDCYLLYKAGVYACKLVVNFGTEPLERMIYLTIQPEVEVYREDGRQQTADGSREQIDLIRTEKTLVSHNPLQLQVAVNVLDTPEALAARNIVINGDSKYRDDLIIKSNLPIDVYSGDLRAEKIPPDEWSSVSTWLLLAEKIRLTRKVDTEYKWSGGSGYNPIIRENGQEKYITFISSYDSDFSSDTNLLDASYSYSLAEAVKPVRLGLEKLPLALPLFVESSFDLFGRAVARYTGSGTTIINTNTIRLPFTVTLTTPLDVKITPEVLTLDDDNNFTSFVAIEANDDAEWTLATDITKLSVTPSSGTGRAAVVVRADGRPQTADGSNFEHVTLTVTSAVNPQVKDTSAVHLEKYTPTTNALIPKQAAGTFNRSLTDFGKADGEWTEWSGTLLEALDDLERFPKLEFPFPDGLHRVRSWSLQSVGEYYGYLGDKQWSKKVATTLILQGWTEYDEWKILDIADLSSSFYVNTKPRVDRIVQHRELVRQIRIVVVKTINENWHYDENWNYVPDGHDVWLPQIQVFAGEPLLPKMISNYDPKFAVRANSSENGTRVFDREVSGSNIATVGSRAWYINNNHFLLEDVAENGKISQFGSYQSKGWFSLIFPASRLLGYLYSIDNLQACSDNHANTSYAASLYFEGRETSNDGMTLEPSLGNWDFIDLASLDHCLGHNDFDGMATSALIVQSNQTTIKNYLQSLGLPVVHDSFLMNRTDRHILRYNATTAKWYDDGLRLEPGTIAANQFNDLTTAELLAETGQIRLNSVALVRGNAMQPPWTTIPDKATIVNQKDAKRMMYDLASQKWSEVPNTDAIYRVHDRTHYEDLINSSGTNPLTLAQLRCTVQSIMNTEQPSVPGEPVAMPEIQFFGLPTSTINAGSEIATVTYLKAEDSLGNLHDILGRHQWLPFISDDSYYGTKLRFYLGGLDHVAESPYVLYLSVSGEESPRTVYFNDDQGYYECTISQSVHYELYVNSTNNEKIILSSGCIGDGR